MFIFKLAVIYTIHHGVCLTAVTTSSYLTDSVNSKKQICHVWLNTSAILPLSLHCLVGDFLFVCCVLFFITILFFYVVWFCFASLSHWCTSSIMEVVFYKNVAKKSGDHLPLPCPPGCIEVVILLLVSDNHCRHN